MKMFRCLTHAAVVLACCGILMPNAAMAAPQVKKSNDLALTANGGLTGVLVSPNGHVIDGAVVTVRQNGKEITKATTDSKGRFITNGLTNGIYQIAIGNKVVEVRAWEATIAPPTAHKDAVIVVGVTARGQGEFYPEDNVYYDDGGGVMGLDIITLWTVAASTGALVLAAINQSDLNDIQDQLNNLNPASP